MRLQIAGSAPPQDLSLKIPICPDLRGKRSPPTADPSARQGQSAPPPARKEIPCETKRSFCGRGPAIPENSELIFLAAVQELVLEIDYQIAGLDLAIPARRFQKSGCRFPEDPISVLYSNLKK